jgi:predicted RNase H-like HicB family nuclease
MKYAIVIEKSDTGYGAWVLDLPGCVATGETEAEVRLRISDAVDLHVKELSAQGDDVPPPTSAVEYVEVTPAA